VSSIVINFPDCAELGSREPRTDAGEHDTITIFTEGCPATIMPPPPLIGWWVWLLGALLVAALIVSTAIVRFRAHERKEAERGAVVAAQVELAKQHKTCDTCGDRYVPEVAG
jgi:hypothetical protein